MKKTVILMGVGFSLLFVFASNAQAAEILARVGDQVFTDEDMAVMEEIIGQELTQEQKFRFLENWVQRRVLVMEAERRGIDQETQTQMSIQKSRDEILIQALFAEFNESGEFDAEVNDEDVMKFYRENREALALSEQVEASHILFRTIPGMTEQQKADAMAKAREVLAFAREPGADFAELAKKYSEGPTGPSGGYLGWFGRGRMVPAFEEAAFAMRAGEVSQDVVVSQFGYHIIKVSGHDAADPDPEDLSEHQREMVEQAFIAQMRQENFDAFLQRLEEENNAGVLFVVEETTADETDSDQ